MGTGARGDLVLRTRLGSVAIAPSRRSSVRNTPRWCCCCSSFLLHTPANDIAESSIIGGGWWMRYDATGMLRTPPTIVRAIARTRPRARRKAGGVVAERAVSRAGCR